MQGLGQVFPKFAAPPDDVMAQLTNELAPMILRSGSQQMP